MKVLVFGCGVIGSYLVHVLCQAGNDVTVAARGKWRQALEENGLRIRHMPCWGEIHRTYDKQKG